MEDWGTARKSALILRVSLATAAGCLLRTSLPRLPPGSPDDWLLPGTGPAGKASPGNAVVIDLTPGPACS